MSSIDYSTVKWNDPVDAVHCGPWTETDGDGPEPFRPADLPNNQGLKQWAYNGFKAYKKFLCITLFNWPPARVRLSDWAVAEVCLAIPDSVMRASRWPADFDTGGNVKIGRMSLDPAAKSFKNGKWLYLSWRGIINLIGEEGLARGLVTRAGKKATSKGIAITNIECAVQSTISVADYDRLAHPNGLPTTAPSRVASQQPPGSDNVIDAKEDPSTLKRARTNSAQDTPVPQKRRFFLSSNRLFPANITAPPAPVQSDLEETKKKLNDTKDKCRDLQEVVNSVGVGIRDREEEVDIIKNSFCQAISSFHTRIQDIQKNALLGQAAANDMATDLTAFQDEFEDTIKSYKTRVQKSLTGIVDTLQQNGHNDAADAFQKELANAPLNLGVEFVDVDEEEAEGA